VSRPLVAWLRSVRPAGLMLGMALVLAGCGWLAPAPTVRGIHVDPDAVKQLVPGTSTKADVTSLIGSPTAHATFDDNTWLYIGERTQPRIGQTLAVLTQQVVVLKFNDQGVLQHIEYKDKDNSLPVTVIARTTPSPGTEANFFQQLFGNIGRFTPGETGGAAAGVGAGAPAPY
jgi:outer membrane protein assembly factor BamE (lipoprotein component of BamABCDE complex)